MPDSAHKPKRRKTLLIAGYILFCLLVLEGGLRVFFSHPVLSLLLQVNDSYSWQRLWVLRHSDDSPEIYYSFDRYHPTLGWISQAGLRDVPVFEGRTLSTNSLGLRGAVDYFPEKEPGKLRILILGDSFTFGDEVSDDETYAHFLQELLPDAEIINMGVHGYGHDQMLLLFLEAGIRLRPDIVVLGFLPIDMERNVVSFRDFAKPLFEVQNGELVLTNSPVPSPETVLQDDWKRTRVIDALSLISVSIRTQRGERKQEMELVTRLILDQLAEAAAFSGARTVLAYLPFGNEITSDEPLLDGEAWLFEYCDGNPLLACFSARPTFQVHLRAGETFDAPFHWSPAGHRVVAQAIYDYLAGSGMLESATGP